MAEATPGAVVTPACAPRSKAELFRVFNRLALQGFGGVLPIAHRELVERERWLAPQEFVDLLALGQVLPGPNIINMALIFGDRHFGWRGALAAIGGLMLAPLAIVMALTLLYARYAEWAAVAGALRGMGAVAAGLVVATGLKLVGTLRHNAMGRLTCAVVALAAFGLVAVVRVPLAAVILGLGVPAVAWAWWRLPR